MRSTRFVALLTLICALALVGAGCGSKSSSSSTASQAPAPAGSSSSGSASAPQSTAPTEKTHFAKTKFVLHAGLAFGAFHRYIYKPFKAGNLTQGGVLKHKKAVAKAAVAGLFAYHEIKVALRDAKSSPLLSKLLTPLTSLQSKLQLLGTRLRGGSVDKASIESANRDVSNVSARSSGAGMPISDQPTPSLGG